MRVYFGACFNNICLEMNVDDAYACICLNVLELKVGACQCILVHVFIDRREDKLI